MSARNSRHLDPNDNEELTSPAKSLQNIFRRSRSNSNTNLSISGNSSNEASEERSRRSLSPRRSPNRQNVSPNRGQDKPNSSSPIRAFRHMIPNFTRSRSSIYTDSSHVTVNSSSFDNNINPFDDSETRSSTWNRTGTGAHVTGTNDQTSLKDFADTSSERSEHSKPEEEYDAESVESILHEYSDDREKAKSFLFKEHFDEKSLTSKNSLSRNKSVKSIIERTLNESRTSNGTDSSKSRYSSSRYSVASGNKSREFLIHQDVPSNSRNTTGQGSADQDLSRQGQPPNDTNSRPNLSKNSSFSTSFNSEKFFDTTNISDADNKFFEPTNNTQDGTHNNTLNNTGSNSGNNSSNNYTTASSSERRNDTTSSSEDRKRYFDSTSERHHTSNTNESSERPLEGIDPRKSKYSMISLNSEELLTRLERSLSNLSEKSQVDNLNQHHDPSYSGNSHSSHGSVDREAMMAFRVSQNKSPKLIHINSPTLQPLEPAHYHDSDISSDYNVSTSSQEDTNEKVMTYAKYKNYGPGKRRPPPSAPTMDSTLKSSTHEKMLESSYNPFSPRTEISGIPRINSADNSITSPEFTDPLDEEDQEYSYYRKHGNITRPSYFGWPYFMLMMLAGLLMPPIYFLLSLGVFDKLKNSKNYYTGIYYRQQYLANRAKIVKFTPVQKLLSLFLGLFWSAVIFAMIGVAFGITQ